MNTLLKAWGFILLLLSVAFVISEGFFIYLTNERASPELVHGLGEIAGALGIFAFYAFLTTIPILIIYVISTYILKA